MEAAKMKTCIKCFVAATAFWAACLWWYLYSESLVSGEEFKTIVDRSSFKSYGSWFLYREDKTWYCLKLSRPVVPERFCVPKKEIEIRNAESGGSELGVVYKDEWVLKKDRYPGAKEEIF
jgi:hypothetical protein